MRARRSAGLQAGTWERPDQSGLASKMSALPGDAGPL
jgi:hypothetical protein